MNVPLWVTELADRFWKDAGDIESFPRSLRKPIEDAVPLSVVPLSQPTVDSVRDWLRANGVDCRITTPNRRLRACLFARFGNGFAFIDSDDSENEQRFSLAHELAHFLRDYLHPRERVLRNLGRSALDVLDGRRSPTPDERVHALLSGIRVGYHVHFMDRDDDGSPSDAIAEVESDADRLAYELLAPVDVIASLYPNGMVKRQALIEMLIDRFGMPRRPAERYAAILCPRARPIDPLLRGLASGI
jgi:hypothetical protein